jgi:hypothetical protein
VNEQYEPDSHAGMLKATEYESMEFFEFGGQQLPLKGTSGPPRLASRTAEGTPIRHELSTAGRTNLAATSGVHQIESRIAEGRPMQHTPGSQDTSAGAKGSGQRVGGPVRRA